MTRSTLVRNAAFVGLLALGGLGIWWAGRGAERSAREAHAPPNPVEPVSAPEWCRRGKEFSAGSRDLPGAIAAFRRAIELDPDLPEAHYGLGLALLQSGDALGASAEIESALSLAPPDASWRKDAEAALVLAHLRKPQGGIRQ